MGKNNTGVIIGAGSAGLSAGETLSRANRSFTVLEASHYTGGTAVTIKYKDFLFDPGAHILYKK